MTPKGVFRAERVKVAGYQVNEIHGFTSSYSL